MNPTANATEPAAGLPTLTGLLYRHCLTPQGQPADHARGLLADLRKLLSPATRNQGLFALGRIGAADMIEKEDKETLAAIFALHPHRPDKPRDLGATCRDLARRGGAKPGDSPFDRHFRRILASRTLDNLRAPVLAAARLAKTSSVAIDHGRLERDFARFRHDPDAVLEGWAKSYFDTREPGEQPPA